MKQSVLIALFISLVIVAYFGVQTFLRGDPAHANSVNAPLTVLESEADSTQELIPTVVTQTLSAEPHPVFLSLKGRTNPNRTVIVRASTTGTVVKAPNIEGNAVRAGTLLCQIGVDARQARLDEAKAMLAAQQEDFNAAQTLVAKKLSPTNRLNTAKANLDAALAGVRAAEIELKHTEIRAPFAGVFENRMAEHGDFLSPGSPCGEITDLDPLKVEAEVSEAYALALRAGTQVKISVLGQAPIEGKVAYVARTANDTTRTFKVEAELPNPDNAISAGLTSQITLKVDEALATAISPGLLILHDDGRVGVRYVDTANTVQFSEVTIIDESSDEIWVTGLPETVTLLAVGQEYVSEGAKVEPVDIGASAGQ